MFKVSNILVNNLEKPPQTVRIALHTLNLFMTFLTTNVEI